MPTATNKPNRSPLPSALHRNGLGVSRSAHNEVMSIPSDVAVNPEGQIGVLPESGSVDGAPCRSETLTSTATITCQDCPAPAVEGLELCYGCAVYQYE